MDTNGLLAENGDVAVDVVVVGGGAAGLSAALTLGRVRRSVLVVDAGEPRNAPAAGVHNLLARDGTAPGELLRLGREEVAGYGGRVVSARVADVRRDGDRFRVRTEDGAAVTARRLLVATGSRDELPDVPGVREGWGRDVLHCPYCHGWEARDTAIGVLATGPRAVHQALLFRQLSADVTLFLHTGGDPDPQEWEQLAALGVAVVDGEVAGLAAEAGRLTGVRLASGRTVPVRRLAVAPRVAARVAPLAGLGLAAVEHPSGAGTHLAVDPGGFTGVPGVWAAGDVADPLGTVAAGAAAAVRAAGAINLDLVQADARAAAAARR